MRKNILSAIVAAVVSLAVALLAGSGSPDLAGTVENFPTKFTAGLFAGSSDQLSVDASGNLLTSGDLSATDDAFIASDLVVGSAAASSSLSNIQVNDATATASLTLDSGGAVGSCIEMRSTTGAAVYARVVGTTWTVTTVSCK